MSDLPPDLHSPPATLPLQSYRDNYHSISNLGNGSFGTVELAKYRHKSTNLLRPTKFKEGTLLQPLKDSKYNLTSLVAIKTMKKRLCLLNDYTKVKEVRFILAISSHPCLVQIYEMFIDDVNYQLHIVMETLNQNLYQLMKGRKSIRFSLTTLKSILSQVLSAIVHIHSNNYFHRDVKPENILVIPTHQYYGTKEGIPPERRNDNFVVKLGDYGLARHIHNLKPYTAYVSTRWYRAPEILLRQRWYSRPIDIWAFGSVAAEVANFTPLFPGSNELDQIWRVLQVLGSPVLPESSRYSLNPLGGFWSEAQNLAEKLGFIFPPDPGSSLRELFPATIHNELAEVVRACLAWDPKARPSAEKLSSMPFFRNTVLSGDTFQTGGESGSYHAKITSLSVANQIVDSEFKSKKFEEQEFNERSKENFQNNVFDIEETPKELCVDSDDNAFYGEIINEEGTGDEPFDDSNDLLVSQSPIAADDLLQNSRNRVKSDRRNAFVHIDDTTEKELQTCTNSAEVIVEDFGSMADVSFGSGFEIAT